MRIMNLSDFFERFASAREMLNEIANSGRIGEPLDEVETSGTRQIANDILGGIVRNRDHTYRVIDSFQRRKSDAVVCESLNLCYVPMFLMSDIRFAEESYKKYFAGGKGDGSE